MNFTIGYSTRVKGKHRPMRYWKLAALMRCMGLRKLRQHNTSPAMISGPRRSLYYIWDEVEALWRIRRRELHPDVPGGSTERFAWLSCVYTEIERRMKMKGILLVLVMLSFTGCHVLNPDGEKHTPDIPNPWRYDGESRLDKLAEPPMPPRPSAIKPKAKVLKPPRAAEFSVVPMVKSSRVSAAALVLLPSVTLIFDASPDASVTGYRIYYGIGEMTNSVDLGLELTGQIGNLVPGETYRFVAVSYNVLGQESVPSNEVSYIVPVPTVPAVVIILWTAQTVAGPWTGVTTNSVSATNVSAVFKQSIQKTP